MLRACESQGVQLQYSEQLLFARQLSSALGFVAANRFVHLDVASRNVMYENTAPPAFSIVTSRTLVRVSKIKDAPISFTSSR